MKFWMRSWLSLAFVNLLFGQDVIAAQVRWDDAVRAAEKEGELSVYATNSVGERAMRGARAK